jgi:hypothetical protein
MASRRKGNTLTNETTSRNALRPLPAPLPATTEKWLEQRTLKAEPTLNDVVEQLHWKLVNDKLYRSYLEAVWDEDAIEGSLAADNFKAAEMLRLAAKSDNGNIVGTKKLATIVKSMNVVLRRYHNSRKERRNTVGGEVVPNEHDNE